MTTHVSKRGGKQRSERKTKEGNNARGDPLARVTRGIFFFLSFFFSSFTLPAARSASYGISDGGVLDGVGMHCFGFAGLALLAGWVGWCGGLDWIGRVGVVL